MGRPVLSQCAARAALRNTQRLLHMIDTATATGSAQKFLRATSVRISLYSVRSDTARLRRWFSFKLLETFELVTAHAAIQLSPTIIRLLSNPNLKHRIRDDHFLHLRHIKLAQLRYYLFGLFSLPSYSLVLLKSGYSYPSGRTTVRGLFHPPSSLGGLTPWEYQQRLNEYQP